MKILFLTDKFPPEVSAQGSRSYEHCREWAGSGDEVTVITCAPNYPAGKVFAGYRNKWRQEEYLDGIRVIRVWSYTAPNKGVFRRTLGYVSFSATSFLAGLSVSADIIVATSPQFFTALSGRALSFWKRRPWIMEVRDLWPESVTAVGALKDSPLIRYFSWQEMRCYKSAERVVVLTDSFRRRLVARGVPAEKIRVVKNGVDRRLFAPAPKDEDLAARLGLSGKTVIGYIGTHGMAHRLDFILRCASRLDGADSLRFLLIGDGAEKESLLALKERLGCRNVTMLGAVPREEVRRYISILDVCLINLRKSELFTTVIPSKIFENAAMGVPILMGVAGEAKEIVEGYGAGLCFEPEDEADFLSKLEEMRSPETRARLRQGCFRLARDFDRKALARRMQRIIHGTE